MHVGTAFLAWERTRARREEAERERIARRPRRHRRGQPDEGARDVRW